MTKRLAGLTLLGLLNLGWSQPSLEVVVRSPQAEGVIGWGRDAPSITLSAVLETNGTPLVMSRLYLTANVKASNGRLVDRVSLYDDGTHGDKQPNDGLFTATYRPPEPQAYRVQVRAQWNEPGTGRAREAWSKEIPFFVEYIPYAHIVYPEPGGKVGRTATLRARLLLNNRPYTAEDPTLHVKVWTIGAEGGTRAAKPAQAVNRRGSLVTAPVAFEGLGKNQVYVVVSCERKGIRLELEPASAEVDVAKPPLLWLIVGLLLIAGYFALPTKRGVTLYNHTLTVRDRSSRRTLSNITLEPAGLEVTRRTVGGPGCDCEIQDAHTTLFTLIAEPGRQELIAQAGDQTMLQISGVPQQMATITPNSVQPIFYVGELEVLYTGTAPARRYRFPRWKPTPLKLVSLLLGIVLTALGWWQYTEFFRQ